MVQVMEPEALTKADKAAAERDARYRAMLPHERFCLPAPDQPLTRVERYTVRRDDGSVVTVTRCQECAVNVLSPYAQGDM